MKMAKIAALSVAILFVYAGIANADTCGSARYSVSRLQDEAAQLTSAVRYASISYDAQAAVQNFEGSVRSLNDCVTRMDEREDVLVCNSIKNTMNDLWTTVDRYLSSYNYSNSSVSYQYQRTQDAVRQVNLEMQAPPAYYPPAPSYPYPPAPSYPYPPAPSYPYPPAPSYPYPPAPGYGHGPGYGGPGWGGGPGHGDHDGHGGPGWGGGPGHGGPGWGGGHH